MIELHNRQDEDLAFMLRFENVAWYQDGMVRILDRRVYPVKTEFVECFSYVDVANAIKDMVTQSEGPYSAAAMGMVLAAYEFRNETDPQIIIQKLKDAAFTLSHARPTTSEQMKGIVDGAVKVAEDKLKEEIIGKQLVDELFQYAYGYMNDNYRRYTIIGKNIADLIPDNGTILTQCFAGTVVGTMLRECKRLGKNVKVYCAETRPYYQGSRLTASVACDMGFDVTVISDNMPAYTMKAKHIDLFTSASDVITMDGHVVNKVGTFQIALAAKYFGIPYYCTGTPDLAHPDMSSVEIEERNPQQVLESFGQRITMDGVHGYYPAFDVTPPELITGIVTDIGTYRPEEVHRYFEDKKC
ncbi:S-methyl-5-thioribose-1-phosphate isomerase [Oribacterium sp. C9]|uniref:S-methyl-5-thioribose-1-phosphate isomerase n=1 Tax=Oribacterium sp. C9 TaxID=1943579 RepID=UPI00099000CC|nr:S-methyl-5-thioribose-1-phosphate isomerase [Oribacterium sp. C9]OON86843.1 S-methyl-5-thioribose-1-phosphate isomerase [Oribacterium sp. C9]